MNQTEHLKQALKFIGEALDGVKVEDIDSQVALTSAFSLVNRVKEKSIIEELQGVK